MIGLFEINNDIFNIDETWIWLTDCRRRKLKMPESSYSIQNPLANPRISLIVAKSNYWEIFYSISKGNIKYDYIQTIHVLFS